MILTITSTHLPATDLGYLLHKRPDRAQSFELSFGQAHVFYPEATEERCTAALLLDVDPVALVRGKRGEARTLAQYVNDRPYVASSFLSVAIARVLSSAMKGTCKDREEFAQTPQLFEATLHVVPCRGGDGFLHRLFEPLGYTVATTNYPLDSTFPEWGDSAYYSLTLSGTVLLSDLLTHIYVLIPVLDAHKHYYFDADEVEKLVRMGGKWLADHPEKENITRRYLHHRQSLVRDALDQLTQEEEPNVEEVTEKIDQEEALIERPNSLHEQRLGAVMAVLKQSGASRVLDLGCGEGKLLKLLFKEKQFTDILGMDVSYRTLERAGTNLRLDRLPPMQRERIKVIHGSLIYRDNRLTGYEAAAVVEVIEHLDPPRLEAFERVLFEFAHPATVVITTPNFEYNPKYEFIPEGEFRHRDHRFEWTRTEFEEWSLKVCERYKYKARFLPIGPEDPELGAPSQMGVFEKI